MKFSKFFRLISLVLLFAFLLEVISPAALMAANFSKKGKYHLNSFTPVPVPIQPKVKSQRSLVNKLMEENVEKPPRTAFYKNGKLLFAREYPELAKRPNTA
ncbi:MAG: hypothetical protein M1536_00565, partial [Firmicutes bacterium]|nr:hypothetical protein [Bacillota bacterium]